MEAHELLNVIDELEDERSRLRRREGIWVSVLAHIVIFLLIGFLPRFMPRVRVVNPGDLKDRERDTTILTLPPNALKGMRQSAPRGGSPPPQQTKAVEAPAAPRQPALEPPRQQAQQQPPPQPPIIRQQPAPVLPSVPAPAQPDAPRQSPTRPSFSTSPLAPGDEVRDAARAAARAGVGSGGGGQFPGRGPAGLAGGAQVLSDTGGWDYGPYIQRVVYETKQAWYPIIPEEVRAPLLKKGIVGIRFKIYRDGTVHDLTLEGRSGDVALDKAAWGGITGASPYPPLPPAFKGPYLELRFGFFYNLDPGVQ